MTTRLLTFRLSRNSSSGQDSVDSDSETEESKRSPYSINHKEAMGMLDKCLT